MGMITMTGENTDSISFENDPREQTEHAIIREAQLYTPDRDIYVAGYVVILKEDTQVQLRTISYAEALQCLISIESVLQQYIECKVVLDNMKQEKGLMTSAGPSPTDVMN
jgi:flagellar biosynthesis regulator FlbT